jgi:hypothetical protein
MAGVLAATVLADAPTGVAVVIEISVCLIWRSKATVGGGLAVLFRALTK